MATRRRYISTGIWKSDLFRKHLTSIDEKFLYLYLLTSPQSSLCGFYMLSIELVGKHTKIKESRILEILQKLEALNEVIFDTGYLWLPGYIELQDGINAVTPYHVPGIAGEYDGQQNNKAFNAFCQRFAAILSPSAEAKSISNIFDVNQSPNLT